MNKWSLTLLVILTSAVIALLVFTSQQSFWAVSAPILSIVLGWLLKTINDSVTISQQHQWELEKIAHERTLKYYEIKLSEMSSFLVDEMLKLVSITEVIDGERTKLQYDRNKFTREWIEWSSSARTFTEVTGNDEIITSYTETADQSVKFMTFINEYNSGKFVTDSIEQIQTKFKSEKSLYMKKIKKFQTLVEYTRLKVLRGEIVIK